MLCHCDLLFVCVSSNIVYEEVVLQGMIGIQKKRDLSVGLRPVKNLNLMPMHDMYLVRPGADFDLNAAEAWLSPSLL